VQRCFGYETKDRRIGGVGCAVVRCAQLGLCAAKSARTDKFTKFPIAGAFNSFYEIIHGLRWSIRHSKRCARPRSHLARIEGLSPRGEPLSGCSWEMKTTISPPRYFVTRSWSLLRLEVPECHCEYIMGLPGGPHLAMGVTGLKESDESILGLV
jgi:hypothetical protein